MAMRFPSGWNATDQSGASVVMGRNALNGAAFGLVAVPDFPDFSGGAAVTVPLRTTAAADTAIPIAMDVRISQSARASDGHHGSGLHERLPGW